MRFASIPAGIIFLMTAYEISATLHCIGRNGLQRYSNVIIINKQEGTRQKKKMGVHHLVTMTS